MKQRAASGVEDCTSQLGRECGASQLPLLPSSCRHIISVDSDNPRLSLYHHVDYPSLPPHFERVQTYFLAARNETREGRVVQGPADKTRRRQPSPGP